MPGESKKAVTLTIGMEKATVDGRSYTLDAKPFIKPRVNRTMVPLRFISEALGAEVEWKAVARQAVISDNGTKIILSIGTHAALVNGKPLTMECTTELLPPGRTFVPLRFVSETLGADVDWNPDTREINITR